MPLHRSIGLTAGLVFTLSVSALAQGVVEYTAGTTPAAAAVPAGKGIGASIGSVFGSLQKTLEKTGKVGAGKGSSVVSLSARDQRTASSSNTPPAHSFEDPVAITAGLDIKELLKRFGAPYIKTLGEDGTQTYWYTSRKGNEVVIDLKGEKVVSVNTEKEPREPGVIVLQ